MALFLFFGLFAPSLALSDTFTATVPAGTEVTMGDPQSVIPVTITNNGPNRQIRSIVFRIDTAKYEFTSFVVPPAGWCIDRFSTGRITFALLQPDGRCRGTPNGSEILPGESLTFNITVLPLSEAADVSGDTFTRIRVRTQRNFTLSGGLPTWTRRALALDMTATPSTTGVGGTITLSMQVTNRSTATQSGITSNPAPPGYSSAIVSYSDGPFYGSTLLNGSITDSDTTITVDSTDEFPASGTIKIGSEEICYSSKTATTFTGVVRGCNGTTAASHTSGAVVYSLTSFSLAPGESGTITWLYSADLTGSVYFTARARDSTATANSVSVDSNTVIIGSFTALLSVSPTSVVSGQSVTVQMTVTNNGTSALINVTPNTLSGCAGGATEGSISGPTPAFISSLAPGASGVFEWTSTITGSVNDIYCFTGSASADGPVTTNTATSNTGSISAYSVTVSPSTIASGTVNQTFTWTLYNGGGCPIRVVRIDIPLSGGDWNCSSTGAPPGWTGGCRDPVRFVSLSRSSDIAPGSIGTFSITFSTTETVTSDKEVSFPIEIRTRRGGGCRNERYFISSSVIVTAYAITLTHSPAGPIYADGSSRYTMTATLTLNGSPVSGKTITFGTTNGTLDPLSAVTDSNGQAVVDLIAPISTTDTSATVTATYINAQATDTVNFTGWTGPNLQYWGGLNPTTVNCGASYSFTMDIKNVSTTATMSLTTSSYFAFNDSTNGGSAEFIAYLDSAVTVSPGETRTLTFGSATDAGGGGGVTVPVNFIEGTYRPDQNSNPPPASGLFFSDGGTNDQYRGVTDDIAVSGRCGTVTIDVIDWHELY